MNAFSVAVSAAVVIALGGVPASEAQVARADGARESVTVPVCVEIPEAVEVAVASLQAYDVASLPALDVYSELDPSFQNAIRAEAVSETVITLACSSACLAAGHQPVQNGTKGTVANIGYECDESGTAAEGEAVVRLTNGFGLPGDRIARTNLLNLRFGGRLGMAAGIVCNCVSGE